MFDQVDMESAVAEAKEDCRTYPDGPSDLVREVFDLEFETFQMWINEQVSQQAINYMTDPTGYTMAVFHLGYAWRRFQENRTGKRDVYLVFKRSGGEVDPPQFEFVEAEDDDGKGINVGEWSERDDGYWTLKVKQMVTS